MLSDFGENPDNFDFICFDFYDGMFIDHLFTREDIKKIWSSVNASDITHLGPVSENPDLNEIENDAPGASC